jgi:YVTN family beta-propeller protein
MRQPLLALLILAFARGIVLSPSLHADEQERLKVGRQADGRIVVPTNQILEPAGKQILFPGRPVDLLLIDQGQTLVVKNMKDLVFIDLPSGKIKQKLVSPVAFSVVGLLPFQKDILVTDTRDHLRRAVRRGDGSYDWGRAVALHPPQIGGAANPAGIAHLDGERVWVTSTRGNCVQLINAASGTVEDIVDVGVAPYAVCCPNSSVCYVSNWGGNRPSSEEPQASSAGTMTQVDARGIASQGTVSVLKRQEGKWRQVKTIRVGLHPSGMVAHPAGHFVYVANANSDTVSVIRTDRDEVVETIVCRPEDRLPFGSGCNALALSPGGERLYVANGTNNCVAVIRLGARSRSSEDRELPQDSRLVGLIPTGWYPGAVYLSGDGKTLYVANVKGVGSLSGPQPESRKPRPGGKNSHDHLGSVSIIDVPGREALTRDTATVNANNRLAYSLAGLEKPRPDTKPRPVPQRHGEPSVFQHVLYIIKENRTYDQVFGDMKEGNGDPRLVLFGEEVTPNHHALARQFTLFDNFYCSGVLSADGHQWCNEAYVTDYLEKTFGAFTRSYPYEGNDPLAFASSGFLWDNALARHRTFHNFGEFVKTTQPPKTTWTAMYDLYRSGASKIPMEVKVNVARLVPYTQANFPGFAMAIPDVFRARLFLEQLRTWERQGQFPNLVFLLLPCDHTSGTRPGRPTPRAMVADNDLALGQIVEAVSHSRFWKDTCIFVVEDDPQDGFDHVDGHRTVALVISPYTRRQFVDSTCYNQTSMVKTIELLLGLPPMNQLDLSATPMSNSFQDRPDLTPYRAVKNKIALDEMNPPLKALKGQALHWARKSLEMNLDEVDKADEDTFNRVLWHAVWGDKVPYPVQYVGSPSEVP